MRDLLWIMEEAFPQLSRIMCFDILSATSSHVRTIRTHNVIASSLGAESEQFCEPSGVYKTATRGVHSDQQRSAGGSSAYRETKLTPQSKT